MDIEEIKQYYYISHCFHCEPNIIKRKNCNDSLDKQRILNGEYYKTKKEAEEALYDYQMKWLENHVTLVKE